MLGGVSKPGMFIMWMLDGGREARSATQLAVTGVRQ